MRTEHALGLSGRVADHNAITVGTKLSVCLSYLLITLIHINTTKHLYLNSKK